jgi:hypothetical protein
MSVEGHLPLRGVLVVAPRRPVLLDVFVGIVPKGRGSSEQVLPLLFGFDLTILFGTMLKGISS